MKIEFNEIDECPMCSSDNIGLCFRTMTSKSEPVFKYDQEYLFCDDCEFTFVNSKTGRNTLENRRIAEEIAKGIHIMENKEQEEVYSFEVVFASKNKNCGGMLIDIKQTKSYLKSKLMRFENIGFHGAITLECLDTGRCNIINLEECYALEVNIKTESENGEHSFKR